MKITKEKIKRLRKLKKMTQAEFAKRIGYSKVYLQKIECGNLPITKEFENNLLKALDLEKAYRKACCNYCEIQENKSKCFWTPLIPLICLIALFLALIY